MAVRPELDLGGSKARDVNRTLDVLAVRVDDADAVERDLGEIAFFEIDDVLRHLDESGSIRCGEVLALAEPEQQRRAHARDDEARWVFFVDDGDGVSAGELADRFARRI